MNPATPASARTAWLRATIELLSNIAPRLYFATTFWGRGVCRGFGLPAMEQGLGEAVDHPSSGSLAIPTTRANILLLNAFLMREDRAWTKRALPGRACWEPSVPGFCFWGAHPTPSLSMRNL